MVTALAGKFTPYTCHLLGFEQLTRYVYITFLPCHGNYIYTPSKNGDGGMVLGAFVSVLWLLNPKEQEGGDHMWGKVLIYPREKKVGSWTSDLYSTSTLEYKRVTIHCHEHLRTEVSCACLLVHT